MGDTTESRLLDTAVVPPSADEQIEFLINIQRLLKEGAFVATYKYALLTALADLCVEKGDDTGGPLTLHVSDIAEKFIVYYWRQTIPYVPPAAGTETKDGKILRQNTGAQAEIVQLIARIREKHRDIQSLTRGATREWKGLVNAVSATVIKQPLWKLQTVGNEHLEFLYSNTEKTKVIVLKGGVAFCFRKFYQLVTDLVRESWARYIRRFNHSLLGTTTDLHEFLFGTDRVSLSDYIPILWDLQKASCFYCGRILRPSSTDVDHFIPWTLYPFDLGHNFVLAHEHPCNSKKADMLASADHLNKWSERNTIFRDELRARFDSAHVVHNLHVSTRIAQWAYQQTFTTKGLTWRSDKELVHLPSDWRVSLEKLLAVI
jgi:hypothetical protein